MHSNEEGSHKLLCTLVLPSQYIPKKGRIITVACRALILFVLVFPLASSSLLQRPSPLPYALWRPSYLLVLTYEAA